LKITWNNALSTENRKTKAMAAAGLFIGLAIVFILNPEDIPHWPCPFKDLVGHSCLTCGLTRSLHAVSHGDLVTSIRYHLMGPLVFWGTFLVSLVWSVEALAGKGLLLVARRPLKRDVVAFFLTTWFVYWVIRLIAELA
jgi:hypothetical protein